MQWLVHVENWVYLGATVLALSHAWREWTAAHTERLRHAAEDIKFYDALAKRALKNDYQGISVAFGAHSVAPARTASGEL